MCVEALWSLSRVRFEAPAVDHGDLVFQYHLEAVAHSVVNMHLGIDVYRYLCFKWWRIDLIDVSYVASPQMNATRASNKNGWMDAVDEKRRIEESIYVQ